MTSPSGPSNFEYSDDSVVGRISFDVPPQVLTDVTQLTQAFSSMATQQEYIARSTGTWLDYMNQVPQIMERANQAYRESITQLERMAYIQNEMGGGQSNVGPSTGASSGVYSTAAPAGYVNPFQGLQYGMGITPDLTSAQQQLGAMASQDPRMYANMMGARGNAVNPALLGMVGGTAAAMTGQGGIGGNGGGQGWGNSPPGSQSPQATQSGRDSAAPPDPAQGGQSTQSEPQTIPANPHDDAPPWQKTVAATVNGAQQVVNEARVGGGGRASTMLGLASAGMTAAGKWSSNNPNALGGLAGRLGPIAKGAGIAGAAALGLNAFQNVGEEIQKYSQLGSVQGGGAMQGVGYELEARMMALNPFINTEQARKFMQMTLSDGFRGNDYDNIKNSLADNFKEMGVEAEVTRALNKAGLSSGQNAEEATKTSRELLKDMFNLSQDGGSSFTERQKQALELVPQLISQGTSAESAKRGLIGLQEGYGDSMALREDIGRIGGQVSSSPMLLRMAAREHGIDPNLLPDALPRALSDAGVDEDEIVDSAARKVASMVRSYPQKLNRIFAFKKQMKAYGVDLDFNQAEAMLDKATGEKSPVVTANERIADKAKGMQGWDKVLDYAKDPFRAFGNLGDAIGDAVQGNFSEAWEDLNRDYRKADAETKKMGEDFANAGRGVNRPLLPSTPQQASQQSAQVRTEGTVQGEVRITVDQNGKVSAPQSIQLSGQQKSANAGYGNAQLNNAPPGDPSFGHSYNGWGEN